MREMSKNQVIAITGNIGSGKSFVCAYLREKGFPVLDLDQVVASLYQNQTIIKKINQLLFQSDSAQLDLKKVATCIFNDEAKKQVLEQFLYPFVYEKMQAFIQQHPISFVEMALVFEKQWDIYFDEVICIAASKKTIAHRLRTQRGLSKEEMEERQKNQLPLEEKINRSDYVIFNDLDITTLYQRIDAYLLERGLLNEKGEIIRI